MFKTFYLIFFFLIFGWRFLLCKETPKKENDLNKKVSYLEKKVMALEKKISILENKIKSINQEESEVKLTVKSVQLLKGATKEGLKFEINIDNLTNQTIDFIFGNIKFLDGFNNEVHSEKFYFDQPISPLSNSQTIIMIESSSPNFEKLKKLEDFKIKFIPSKIIKKEKNK
jgi:Cu/Ag efflux protein CusF